MASTVDLPESPVAAPLPPQSRRFVAGRGARIAFGALGFAAITLVTYLIAHYRIFTGFADYDDEGYMLIALKSFIHHGSLYDDVFSQYGPFYYEFWGGLFSAFGIAVSHDAGRTATLVAWVLASLTVGVATARMTASILLGLATQMLVFSTIVSLTNEPMHPGGLICLLLAAILAISCAVRPWPSPGAMALLGAAVAALILVKINVGLFALAAFALVAVVSYPFLGRLRGLRPLVEVGFVAIPVVLMSSKFGEEWARHYAAHVVIAALAIVVVLRSRVPGKRDAEELVWFVGGLVLTAAVVCLAVIASGTSLGGLVEGVVTQPLRQDHAFTVPFALSGRSWLLDLTALGAALGYAYGARGRETSSSDGWRTAVSLFSLAVGVEMALSVIGKALPFDQTNFEGFQLSMLGFAWVGLIPLSAESTKATAFSQLLVPTLAVMQSLHAFPVAGSQIALSSFLLVPVAALCVAGGVRGLSRSVGEQRLRRALAVAGLVSAAGLSVLLVNTNLREPLRDSRDTYDMLESLGLPGSSEIRLNPGEGRPYRQVAAEIDANCPAVVMLPGMDSFYLWTQQEPPTGFNATAWPTLFDDAHQQRVIDETRSIRGLCLLENIPLARAWGGGSIPAAPLVRYLHRGFLPLMTTAPYRLLQRPGAFEGQL